MTSTTMSARNSGSSTLSAILVSVLVIGALFVIGALLLSNAQATVAGEITASGGRGKAQTYGASENLTISATEIGEGMCNYKAFKNHGTQVESGYPQPCNEEGFQNYLKHLLSADKIDDFMYEALKAIPKFW